jgi:DNA-binding YbaB/EbfC family protein
MDMMKMMQQAKEMQEKMQAMQAKLQEQEVVGQSGGGMVSVTMTCKGEMRDVKIAPEVIDPTDPEMLEDLIKAACNDAKAKADEKLADETKAMMGGMGLPSDMKLPF